MQRALAGEQGPVPSCPAQHVSMASLCPHPVPSLRGRQHSCLAAPYTTAGTQQALEGSAALMPEPLARGPLNVRWPMVRGLP